MDDLPCLKPSSILHYDGLHRVDKPSKKQQLYESFRGISSKSLENLAWFESLSCQYYAIHTLYINNSVPARPTLVSQSGCLWKQRDMLWINWDETALSSCWIGGEMWRSAEKWSWSLFWRRNLYTPACFEATDFIWLPWQACLPCLSLSKIDEQNGSSCTRAPLGSMPKWNYQMPPDRGQIS